MYNNFFERIKDNKKVIGYGLMGLALTIISMWKFIAVPIFAYKLDVIVSKANFETSYNEVIKQADDNDWIKKKDYSSFKDMLLIKVISEGTGKSCIDLVCEMLNKSGSIGSLSSKELKHEVEELKAMYILKGSDGINKTSIELNAGENEDLTFYKGDQELSFDLSEKAFNQKQDFSPGKSYIEKLVLAYTDEPQIATIHNGRITAGNKKGTTNLNVYKDGWLFTYKVTVQ